MAFRFINKNNRFSWENDTYKVSYSNPHMFPNQIYDFIKHKSEISSFYYDVQIFKNKDGKWELLKEISTYNSPSILSLYSIIKEFTKNNSVQNKEIITKDDTTMFQQTQQILDCESYILIKTFNSSSEFYNFYVGLSDFEDSSIGIQLKVNKEDLLVLSKCIDAFVKYAMKVYNENTKNEISYLSKNKEIKNNKLYCYQKDQIKNIFNIDDSIGLVIHKKGHYESVDNAKIKAFADNNIYVTNSVDELVNFNLKDVLEIELNLTKELNYDISDIVIDFKKVMSNSDHLFFKEESVDNIYYKYNLAIMNRTKMYLKDHPYVISSDINDIKPFVYSVIYLIKESLKDVSL